ncbi:metallophosphatase family protein [Robertmurraya korlensis]|uniref:metallophosphoesterase family protein n=1 Tax=Robertmurraya korlensis TaxID=519977 RepID=UPI00203EF45F|nr:metallophosphoesterase family protein [Robertmurraya korlensis]MCM3601242.1 metallophosphatase family protein [Robertmurraya korlensis]
MKIIVISDTHMPKKAKRLPLQVVSELQQCDLIIHAGDWQTIEIYHELLQYGQVKGVFGNVDSEELQGLLPEKLVVDIEGVRIGVVHGHGKRWTTERRTMEAFADDPVDCIIFGHSHIPILKVVNGILLFNPGSCTDKRRQPKPSFGIITVKDGIHAEHVFFNKE